MTSTPASLNDESLNGSWIDINSASQIHSPIGDDSPEFLAPPYSLAESVQSLGLISFQVERFLQEAQQRNQGNSNEQNLNQRTANNMNDDNNSGLYVSDSDVSLDELGSRAMINSLRQNNGEASNSKDFHSKLYHPSKDTWNGTPEARLPKCGGSMIDIAQLSDSLSLISRASASRLDETNFKQQNDFQDFDWLWDWTAQPEYFAGQEWKVSTPRQEYLMRQRQMYCTTNPLNKNHTDGTAAIFSSDMVSLLFLTNILSIIIGAGVTYSILIRRPTV